MKSLAIVILSVLALAQSSLPSLTPTEENTVLKSQHDVDTINNQISQIATQFAQLQAQAKELQDRYPQLQKQLTDAQKKEDDAISALYTAHKVDKSKADFDKNQLKFIPKAEAKK